MTSLPPPWRLGVTLLATIVLFGGVAAALELLTVEVPDYAIKGDSAKIFCSYSLDDDASLYSLKWYKGDHQFYQYIPANVQSKNTFFLPGIDVDMARSNAGSVVLRNLGFLSSGTYRCEVIAEAPVFHTKLGEGNLTVIDPPESAPVLEGARPSYHVGERVTMNCTSSSSWPAAELEWYVNDQLVTDPFHLRDYEALEGPDGLETAVLGLSFPTTPRHFQQGVMRLKCVARIADIYFQSQETSVVEASSRLPHTLAEGRRHIHLGSGGRSGGGNPDMMLFSLALSLTTLITLLLPLPLSLTLTTPAAHRTTFPVHCAL
ncbi:uncharacterized protein LOC126997936 [Eriocheir sinensis]|uniref:uncharacterized protein LOC126997936 n=1 Tax=Eriocheir sinensis TaxID=95602 RepID=UPI0021C72381|nr:uncharacterized protein LOC126997936 [Eriocheir sinensis]